MKKSNEFNTLEGEDFSIVLGGPFFQLLRRLKLEGNHLEMVKRRMLVFVLITWVPLFVLSLIDGKALPGSSEMPFLTHADVYTKFLVCIPLLLASELLVNQRLRLLVDQFKSRKLVPEEAVSKYDAAVRSAMRIRNSYLAEFLIIIIVYLLGIQVVFQKIAVTNFSTWFVVADSTGSHYTLAGLWYAYLSTPIFQFLLLRWYFRLFIWARFLWQVSRIELNLIPTHPDNAGGLGFLTNTVPAFAPLASAHGVLLAGVLADKIFHTGATLPDFKVEIIAYSLYVLAILLAPLLLFAAQLSKAKRMGFRNYGNLASQYVREFDNKWIENSETPNEPLVGSSDIQSLADLANSYEVIKKMQLAPVNRQNVLMLALSVLLPLSPLMLTIMPLEELIKKLLGILL